MGLVAASQPSLVTYRYDGHPAAEKGIIRTQNIAYFEERGMGYFAYVLPFPPTPVDINVKKVQVPDGWHVLDFRVEDGIAYFCGIDSLNHRALLGDFDIGALISGGSVVFHHDDNINGSFSCLNRIAVKMTNEGMLSLMAIGQDAWGTDPVKKGANRVLYMQNYKTSVAAIFELAEEPELAWDVVATEGYFAMVGTLGRLDAADTLCLRKTLCGVDNATFLSSFMSRYKYGCTYRFSSGIRAAQLGGDTIALASYYETYFSMYSDKVGMQEFTVYVPNCQMYHNQSYSILMTPSSGMAPAPKDMVYLPDSNALMVIDTVLGGGLYWSVFRIDPYPTVPYGSYYGPFAYHLGVFDKPLSLTVVSSGICLVTDGYYFSRLIPNSIVSPIEFNSPCGTEYRIDNIIYPEYSYIEKEIGQMIPYKVLLRAVQSSILEFTIRFSC